MHMTLNKNFGGVKMIKRIIRNAKIRGKEELTNIIIEGERIFSISQDAPIDYAEEYDAGGNLVLPGLVNIHAHLDKSKLADRITNISGTIYEAREKLLKSKAGITKEDVKERSRRTIFDAVATGTTAVRTHVDVDNYIGLNGIEALLELKSELSSIVDIQIVAFPQEGIAESPGAFELLKEALCMGADVVGGHLSIAKDYGLHTSQVFDLAAKFNKDIDIHVDYDIDKDYTRTSRYKDGIDYPSGLGAVYMAFEKENRSFGGRVIASHLCGLDAVHPELAKNVLNLLKRSQIDVVALPPNNLYMHGRSDKYNVRRGVTKVKELLQSGVSVVFGTDNIRDPFNPLGNPDMIHNAILTAYACHMSSTADYEKLFDMITMDAARIMGLQNYGIEENCYADLIVLDAVNVEGALANQANVKYVFKKGRLVAMNEIKRKLCLAEE